MNTIIEEKKSITIIKHKIICDICGKELDIIEEEQEGYYYNPYKREVHINPFYNGYYKYKKDLCDDCYNKIQNNFINILKDFGFESEDKNNVTFKNDVTF